MTAATSPAEADRALKAKHRAMWALGDYAASGQPRHLRTGSDSDPGLRGAAGRPGARHSRWIRQCRYPRRPGRSERCGLRPDPRAAGRRPGASPAARRGTGLAASRRRGAHLRRWRVRHRDVMPRHHVRPASSGQQGRPPRVGGFGQGARVEATDRSEHFFERRPPAAGPQRPELAARRRRLLGGLGRGGDHHPVRADRPERAEVEVGPMVLGRARARARSPRRAPGSSRAARTGSRARRRGPPPRGARTGRCRGSPATGPTSRSTRPPRPPAGRPRPARTARRCRPPGGARRRRPRRRRRRRLVGGPGGSARPDEHDVHRPLDGGQHRLRGLPGQHHDGRRIAPHGPIIAPRQSFEDIFPSAPSGRGR